MSFWKILQQHIFLPSLALTTVTSSSEVQTRWNCTDTRRNDEEVNKDNRLSFSFYLVNGVSFWSDFIWHGVKKKNTVRTSFDFFPERKMVAYNRWILNVKISVVLVFFSNHVQSSELGA